MGKAKSKVVFSAGLTDVDPFLKRRGHLVSLEIDFF